MHQDKILLITKTIIQDLILNKMFHENYNGVSPNPMDTNWGGDNFTQNLVEKGFYKNREVNIYNP